MTAASPFPARAPASRRERRQLRKVMRQVGRGFAQARREFEKALADPDLPTPLVEAAVRLVESLRDAEKFCAAGEPVPIELERVIEEHQDAFRRFGLEA